MRFSRTLFGWDPELETEIQQGIHNNSKNGVNLVPLHQPQYLRVGSPLQSKHLSLELDYYHVWRVEVFAFRCFVGIDARKVDYKQMQSMFSAQ